MIETILGYGEVHCFLLESDRKDILPVQSNDKSQRDPYKFKNKLVYGIF